MTIGRPSDYNPEIAAKICERMALGETLTDICKDEGFPSRVSVWRWTEAHEDFRNAYSRARECQMESWADDIVHISDDSRNDTQVDEDGHEVTNHDVIARSRLRVDTRKFLMSKIAPRLYGDKLALTGADGGAIKTEDVTPQDDRALARKIAMALTKGVKADDESAR